MVIQPIISSIINNLFKAGLIVAISLTLLEKISSNLKYVGFFSFISGSFFIVKLFQYNTISINKITSETFLIHSIIGGFIWCIYAILMYILFKLNYSTNQIIAITTGIIIIINIFYYYFATQNFFGLFE
jgi:hypothetical protein